MSRDHRRDYHRAWSQITPPLNPDLAVVDAVKKEIADFPGRTLLLGVTPQLADIASDLVAIDRNFSMVENVWPGDTPSRRAVVGEWRNSNFVRDSFSACIGDGSLCGQRYPHEIAAVLEQVRRILQAGGRFVCRLYLAPDEDEAVTEIRDAAMAGAIANFHECKFRIAMALAARRPTPDIDVDAILTTFDALFGDRDGLVRATGWSRPQIDTIDHYRGSTAIFSFPKRDQVLALVARVFVDVRLLPVGTYPMAERCPLLVGDKAKVA
jgi:hypothetical protein